MILFDNHVCRKKLRRLHVAAKNLRNLNAPLVSVHQSEYVIEGTDKTVSYDDHDFNWSGCKTTLVNFLQRKLWKEEVALLSCFLNFGPTPGLRQAEKEALVLLFSYEENKDNQRQELYLRGWEFMSNVLERVLN